MKALFLFGLGVLVTIFGGCSATLPVHQAEYAKLRDHRTYEYDFPTTWKAIEETLRNFKVVDRDPSDVDPQEMKTLKHRTLETDWVYSQSRDKYITYTINDTPRQKYLQIRWKAEVSADAVMGGTTVTVKATEEIEKLRPDGSSAGYEESDSPDTHRVSELLDKFGNAILSAAP